jgi:hypothetical protein
MWFSTRIIGRSKGIGRAEERRRKGGGKAEEGRRKGAGRERWSEAEVVNRFSTRIFGAEEGRRSREVEWGGGN